MMSRNAGVLTQMADYLHSYFTFNSFPLSLSNAPSATVIPPGRPEIPAWRPELDSKVIVPSPSKWLRDPDPDPGLD